MKHLTILAVLAMLVMVGSAAMAATDTATQTFNLGVDEIAVIDVTANPGAMTITAPEVGGNTPVADSDNSTYAQYTSTVAASSTRTITAQITTNAVPAGTKLELTAAPAAGMGTTAGKQNITTGTPTIVTAIGSCATGVAATDGAQLTYDFSVDDVTALVAGVDPVAVTVTLTLTEDAE